MRVLSSCEAEIVSGGVYGSGIMHANYDMLMSCIYTGLSILIITTGAAAAYFYYAE